VAPLVSEDTWSGRGTNRDAIDRRLERVGRYEASRTILCTVEDGRRTVDATVVMSYTEPSDGGLGLVHEKVEIEMGGDHLSHLETIVDPVLASIGQAHAATLDDGTEVVVKIRRSGRRGPGAPGLGDPAELGRAGESTLGAAAGIDLVGVTHEFARTLRAELDCLHEAARRRALRGQLCRRIRPSTAMIPTSLRARCRGLSASGIASVVAPP
jgi:hypothetical protein